MNHAGFWIRCGAFTIDAVLLMVIILPALFMFYGEGYWAGDELIKGPMDFILSWVLPGVLVIAFWIRKQATPGKIILSLKIVDAQTGGSPTAGQFIGRYFAQYISAVPIGLGFFWIAFDSRKQGWHDKLAGTLVVHKNGIRSHSDGQAKSEGGEISRGISSRESNNIDKWIMAGFTSSGYVVRFPIDFASSILKDPGVFVGRDPSQSDFHIRDDSVSRKHALITVENGALFIRDLSSTNGTYVNNKQLNGSEKRRLEPEDSIQLGNVTLSIGRD